MAKRVFIIFIMWLSLSLPGLAWGTLYYYSGTMDAEFGMTHTITLAVPDGTTTLTYIFQLPEDYSLPTNTQDITGINFTYPDSPTPSVENYTDTYGNHLEKFIWQNPSPGYIYIMINYTVSTTADWNKFVTSDKFPFNSSGLPASVATFLQPSDGVQSDNSELVNLANALTSGITTQWEAVKALNAWVMDNIYYGNNSDGTDALSTYNDRLGTCTNYVNIALALIRAAGIPARLAIGYTLDKTYTLPGSTMTWGWEQGTHAWIEVYYPSLGWVPYDPQRDFQHVDTYRVLCARGPDVNSIVGRASWAFSSPPPSGSTSSTGMNETFYATGMSDSVNLSFIKSTDEVSVPSLSTAVTFKRTKAMPWLMILLGK